MSQKFYYGGQAVIEGVMMRGVRHLGIAVRRPNGEIAVTTEPLGALYIGSLRRLPLVRGVIVLLETLILGIKVLLYSANVAVGEEEENISPALLWGTAAFGLILGLGLFLLLPLVITHLIDPYIGSSVVSNVVDGVLRLAIVIVYLGAINLMPDIRRVWAYHGAEHKTINAYEDGAPLEPAAVQGYSTAHSRCGTGFMLIVLVIAIIAFAFLGQPPLWLRLLSRLALLPVIAAISYEIIRFWAGHSKNSVVRFIMRPSLALQVLTTREPDDQQLEVAISALNGVLEADAAP